MVIENANSLPRGHRLPRGRFLNFPYDHQDVHNVLGYSSDAVGLSRRCPAASGERGWFRGRRRAAAHALGALSGASCLCVASGLLGTSAVPSFGHASSTVSMVYSEARRIIRGYMWP